MSNDKQRSDKKEQRVLAEMEFEPVPLQRGYAGHYLKINLSRNIISTGEVTNQMKKLWTGGKGFDLWLTLQEIDRNTHWDNENNPICFSAGPLGGTTSFPGSGKTIVTTISPMTNLIIDSNVGGHFGPLLKFSGFDALVVVGRAAEEVIIDIDAVGKRVAVEASPGESIDSHLAVEELTALYADNELDKKNISVVASGKGAEHSRMGILNFSFWDWRRNKTRIKQAGRGGVGTVFRHKKIKAIVVKNRNITPAWNIEESKLVPLVNPERIYIQEDPAEIESIRKIIDRWDSDPEYLIEMMQDIQDHFRHISKTAIDLLNRDTGTPRAEIYHIATFYNSFSLEPQGETLIQVCLGTACHVKGAANILSAFERVLGIKAGETTADKKFSLSGVRCLGACSMAPVVKIGDMVIGNVEARNVEKLIREFLPESSKQDEREIENSNRQLDKITSSEELAKIKETQQKIWAKYRGMLLVCTGTGCASARGLAVRDRLIEELKAKNMDRQYLVVSTGCNGFCAAGPIIVIQPQRVFYQKVEPEDIPVIVEEHLQKGKVVEKLLYKDPVNNQTRTRMEDIEFFSEQQLIVLRNKGLIDPENIDYYITRDGYKSFIKAMAMEPHEIIAEITASGIRGRGGGGFPTGFKWSACRKAMEERGEVSYVVCNADEGDPGAFVDRSIIETDPHAVIEGMLIAALAVEAREGFIYIRKEYPLALKRLKMAIQQAQERGLLGKSILNSNFSFDIHIHRGAGAFVCGESTALMATMSGRAGEPRSKYIHSTESGFRGKPTALNNVETFASIPAIISMGATWYSSIGSGDVSKSPWDGSSGTKVFSLVGDINNTGLVEVPMGITLKDIVYKIGGGIPNGRKFKAIQTGGPSGGCLPEEMLDLKVDFDSLSDAGSMMGSGGMIVMDDHTCMVDVARYFINFLIDESCGKCTPCREGLRALDETLTRITRGEGREGDIEFLEEVAETVAETSLCQLGKTAPNPVLSTIRYFRDEYEKHIREKKCPAGVCRDLIVYHITENCNGCTLCAKNCPTKAISGETKGIHWIDQNKCIKCGICLESCKFDAVEVI